MNYGRYYGSKEAIQLGTYDTKANINSHPEISINNAESGIFKEVYDDVKSICANNYNVAMISDQYISDIQDIAVFWNDLPENHAEEGFKSYLRIVYLTDDTDTWKVLLRDDGEGNPFEAYNNYNFASVHGGTGVSGFNNHIAFAGNHSGSNPSSEGDFAKNLKGKNARIGIIIGTNQPQYNFYYYITGLMINRSKSIKSYIDFLDNRGWTCSAIAESGNNYNSFLKMGAYKMLDSQANALNIACTLTNCREATYFDQFVYFCNYAGVTAPSVSPSSSIGFLNGLAKTADGNLIAAVVSLSALTLVSVVLVLGSKKKHN